MLRLLVSRGHSLVNDLRFGSGPIYVGRQPRCHVFLPDQGVSRQHAVIFTSADGNWMVQDLDSANRTAVNGRPVSRLPLHEGDIITICDFRLEVHHENESKIQTQEHPLDLGDTLVGATTAELSIFKTTRTNDQPLRLTGEHLKHFYEITVVLCHQDDQKKLLSTLAENLLKQLDAFHVWAGLREDTSGPLTCYGGCSRGGNVITLDQLAGRKMIRQAVNDASYILVPNLADLSPSTESTPAGIDKLRSAMAAPIVGPAGAYGVIYVDNGADQTSYARQDLDYLTLISTQLAAFVEHIG